MLKIGDKVVLKGYDDVRTVTGIVLNPCEYIRAGAYDCERCDKYSLELDNDRNVSGAGYCMVGCEPFKRTKKSKDARTGLSLPTTKDYVELIGK